MTIFTSRQDKAWYVKIMYFCHISLKGLSYAQMTEKGTFGFFIYLQENVKNKAIYVFWDAKATKKTQWFFFWKWELKSTVSILGLFFDFLELEVWKFYPFISRCIPHLCSIFIKIGPLEHFQKNTNLKNEKNEKKNMTFFAIYEKTKQDTETAMYHVPPLTISEYLETRTDFLL